MSNAHLISNAPVKPTITEAIDRALQAAYAQGIVPGKTLPALARQFAIPKWRLKRRAMELGISVPRLKTPYWTEAEVEYLHTIAHLNLTVIRKKLIAAALGIHGRPPEMVEGRRLNVYLDAKSLETAARLGDGNVSEGIRIALKDR